LRVDIVKKTATGTSKLAINKTNYGAYKLPFFDYEHQLIFRDKIEKINEISQNFDLSIDDQLVLFKKLRQQILQEAIEGKLTAEWRKNNPELTGGNNHASKLLEQIKGEKEQLVKDKKIKKQKPLAPITDDEKPFVVPDGWGWSRIGQVGTVNRGKSPIYDKCGKKLIINQKCVRWFNVDAQHCKTISSNWFQALPKELQTDVNDVLVNSTGEGTIGRSAVVDEKSAGLIFDSHVLRIKLHIEPKYAAFLINSNFGQNQINDLKGAKSTKQTELGVNNLTNFVCPLPPLFEQKVIVERVDKLMHMIDMLEVQGTERKEQSKMLMQAVLQEAFEVEV
jgi:type I restriction enzyme S subunit